FILYQQFNYLAKADLGYDDSHLIKIENEDYAGKGRLFNNQLSESSDILEVAAKNPGSSYTMAHTAEDVMISFMEDVVTANYLPTLKVPIVQGRGFLATSPTDTLDKVLVNEAFVKQAGWTQPLGQKLTFT